ncbi:hypothetical protein GCM10020221_19610 [Streptomyces thioluteus]|uniref:Condensation domain-containing protein n=1 Tax=Streptomyces thioluteus TaxID=66431 RepID=A0ABN3WRF6_STRTU
MSAEELAAARDALPSGRASANAVFLAATAGALRGAGAAGRLPFLPGVCAMVPVDVRPDEDAALLGNHYSTVRVPLPVRGRPGRRLAAVDRFTRRVALHERALAQARAVAGMAGRRGPLTEVLGRYVDSPLYSSVLCSSLADRGGPADPGVRRPDRSVPAARAQPRPPLGGEHGAGCDGCGHAGGGDGSRPPGAGRTALRSPPRGDPRAGPVTVPRAGLRPPRAVTSRRRLSFHW